MPGDIGAFPSVVWQLPAASPPASMLDITAPTTSPGLADTVAVVPPTAYRELHAPPHTEAWPPPTRQDAGRSFPYHDPYNGCAFAGDD